MHGERWARIYGEASWGIWSPFLASLSMLYGVGVRTRLAAYASGLLKRRSLPGYVVSVGNLTAGGTGKTPAVARLARWGADQQHRVAVLSRGYGGRSTRGVMVVSDGTQVMAGPGDCGDEPYLLASWFPGIPVIVSRDRYAAGRAAVERYGAHLLILDDGFQHIRVKRDLDLVLMDAVRPFGNGRLLPMGPLREPLSELRRADAFVLTRCRAMPGPQKTMEFLRERFPGAPVFLTDHLPDRVVFPTRKTAHEAVFVRGLPVVAFAGIARPASFLETLKGLGAEVLHFRAFGDHHPYSRDEIRGLVDKLKGLGAQCLLTTEKDWVRALPVAPACPEFGFLSIRLEFLSGEDAFFRMVQDGLERKRSAVSSDL